jgi:DNA-binding MarR family transcriptional regulator
MPNAEKARRAFPAAHGRQAPAPPGRTHLADGGGGGDNWALGERPGFLIRRLHQIHISLFSKHCGHFGVTPVQYSLMSALAARGVADQTMLAADVALDRTTTTGAVKRLQERGLTRRIVNDGDRRARLWSMTRQGAKLLSEMQRSVREAHDATIAALDPKERTLLVGLLSRLVANHEDIETAREETL